MSNEAPPSNLPAAIADAIAGIPARLVPASVKAFDRLIGAAVDIPAAWLAQHKARVDAQTAAYILVENAIATAAANEAGASPEFVQQAVNVLVRKSYRKQKNVHEVSVAALADLRSDTSRTEADPHASDPTGQDVDDDWLNVFERYAEDASTERMQHLWGRVLAGEIRRPGRYAMRTLRFLSEFSQQDALLFANFAQSTFAGFAPKSLARPSDVTDLKPLMALEAAGLIQGASGLGLTMTLTFDNNGIGRLQDEGLWLVFLGPANGDIKLDGLALTPLGAELVTLLPGRDARAAALKVAACFRQDTVRACYLAVVGSGEELNIIQKLWEDAPATTEASAG